MPTPEPDLVANLRAAKERHGGHAWVDLADAAGMEAAHLADVLDGTRDLSSLELTRIADALQVDPNWLLTGTGDVPEPEEIPGVSVIGPCCMEMLDAAKLDLDAIEIRASLATPGRWRPWDRGVSRREDAEFITAARTDVPALAAEVRRLRARVAGLLRENVGLSEQVQAFQSGDGYDVAHEHGVLTAMKEIQNARARASAAWARVAELEADVERARALLPNPDAPAPEPVRDANRPD